MLCKIRAKVWGSSQPVMDDRVNSGFEFMQVISKEVYTGDETFEIGLEFPRGFGSGGNLAVKKEDGQFKYGEQDLRPIDAAISQELDEFLRKENEIDDYEKYREYQEFMQILDLKAVVTHDLDNYGKGYLVHRLKIAEKI